MNDFVKGLILLNMIEGLGPVKLKLLLDRFKEPRCILEASFDKLASIKGMGPVIACSIKKAGTQQDLEGELNLIKKYDINILSIFDADYPENLKNIYDPPVVLYVKGRIIKEDLISVSVVGSRKCTYYGINMAGKISGGLAERGVTIVSGLARGIDTAAHKGALRVNGRTIAVLGNGLMDIYPAENRPLAKDISLNGAVVSEFPMQMAPHRQNFPRRNRIISGLSKAVIVVEAARKSGALITADFALEQGRDVFAIPGLAGNTSSAGTNSLIKQGARLVDSVDDILEELETGTHPVLS